MFLCQHLSGYDENDNKVEVSLLSSIIWSQLVLERNLCVRLHGPFDL